MYEVLILVGVIGSGLRAYLNWKGSVNVSLTGELDIKKDVDARVKRVNEPYMLDTGHMLDLQEATTWTSKLSSAPFLVTSFFHVRSLWNHCFS